MKSYMCFVFLLAYGCANVVPPGGGEKDIVPPRLVFSDPKNNSVLFDGSDIFLEFDEYIQLQNIGMIRLSPRCPNGLDVTQRGRQVRIKILCPLEQNTTYTINFGKSIIDLNEGNALQNFKYTFSTGNYIDSLSLRGKIDQLYFNDDASNILVGLYQHIDSVKPYFYTFAQNGNFVIDNIKSNTYTLYAIDDKDNNFEHSDGELISFPKTINTFDTIINLNLFYDAPEHAIINIKNPSKHSLHFEHTIMQDSIIILNTRGLWDNNHISSTFWFQASPHFIKYQLGELVDSVEVYNTDSLRIKLVALTDLGEIKKRNAVTIKCSKPIKSIFPGGFRWEARKDSVTPILEDLFTIIIPIDFNTNNNTENLIINGGSIGDIFGFKNDSINFNFNFNSDSYGQLNIRCLDLKENTIVELFQKNIIIQKLNLKDSVSMSFIRPGRYNIRTFEDLNADGFWTTGKIKNSQNPEPLQVYPDPIDIKSNWEIDISINQ